MFQSIQQLKNQANEELAEGIRTDNSSWERGSMGKTYSRKTTSP